MKLKYYLIASPENNYHPWILSKTAMACFVVSIWTLRLFLPGYIAVGAPGLDSQDLMSRINQERTSRLMPALVANTKLSAAATIKSQDMIDRDYFAHVDPDGNYAWPLIEAQGYKPYKSLGENLAVDFSSASAVINAWMNSPGHRANILSEKYKDQGMAAVYGEFEDNHETYLVTNLFGTLMTADTPPPAPAPIESDSPAPTTKSDPNPTPAPNPTRTLNTTPSSDSDEGTKTVPVTPAQTPQPSQTPEVSPASTQVQPTTPEDSTSEPVKTSEVIIESPNQNNPLLINRTSEKQDLYSLKIVIGIFAGIYTLFLLLDSWIIHRAKIHRENMSSSPHAVMMSMVAIVNILTLWL